MADFEGLPKWLTVPKMLLLSAVGAALGLASGYGVAWADPLFVVYLAFVVGIFGLSTWRKRRER